MTETPQSARRVLIVDDIDEDRRELRRLLLKGRDRRYTFVEAANGAACLQALADAATGDVDCMLLDFSLPDMNALQVLDAIRLADGTLPLPVLVVTVSADHDPGRASLRAGAQDFIEKESLSPSALAHALDNAVERWTMARELQRSMARNAFFLALSEASRTLVAVPAFKRTAARLLGQHLGLSRVVFSEISESGEVVIERGYVDGVDQIEGRYHLRHYGDQIFDTLRAGRAVVINDVGRDADLDDIQRAAYRALDIGANLSVPLLQDGAVVAVLAVHQSRPRAWTEDDVALVGETAERVLSALERGRAEERLRSSERRLRLALQAGEMGVWLWNPRTGESEGDLFLQRLTGLSSDVAIPWAEQFLDRVHEQDRAVVLEDAERVMRNGGSYRHEMLFRRPDGREVWLAAHGMAVPDETGQPAHLIGVNFDISARKKVEAALMHSEARLRRLIELMPSFTAVLSGPEHRYEFANQPYHDLIGRGREILGQRVIDAMPELVDQPFPALLDRVYVGGEPYQATGMPVRLRRGQGAELEERFIDFAYMPLRNADRTIGGLLIHGVDRTEQVHAERRLLDADRRKDEFLATLAHELRNPLAPIRNGLALLRRSSGEPQAATVEMMKRQLVHLVNLVDDLLDVSRVNLGKVSLKIERLHVADKIAHAIEACQPAIAAGCHRVVVEPAAEDFLVDGDRTRVVQVIANLLVNAAKYSEPGGCIRVSTAREGEAVVIRVGDTGIGIAAEELPTLWSMFGQVRDTLDKAQGGLGIGLALVKKLVELHGGSVGAESAGVGRGSTFIVRLPLARGVSPTCAPAVGVPAERPATSRRVLLVDDNADAVESLAMLLEMSGHRTDVAHAGTEALRKVEEFRPNVVLLDIGLPGMDGYEVARRLRADPRFLDLMLVAITGWGSDQDKRKASRSGFDAHLTKPVDVEAIEALLIKMAQTQPPDAPASGKPPRGGHLPEPAGQGAAQTPLATIEGEDSRSTPRRPAPRSPPV